MRSEFEKNRYWIGLFKTDVEFNGLLGEFGRYELNGSRDVDHRDLEDFNSKWEAYAKAWQHQQSKVDELQKGNDALVHVIKSRDIQLENEKHEYDELMNKLVDSGMKNAELQKQNAWLSGVAERENKRANNLQQDKTSTTILLGKTIQEKNELTKQRDSFIKAYEIEMDKSVDLQKRLDAVKQLIEEYRDPPTEDKTFQHALSIVAYELEQALKGGGK